MTGWDFELSTGRSIWDGEHSAPRFAVMDTTAIPCDSCFIYIVDQDKLVLRASKNPHSDLVDKLMIQLGQGVLVGLPSTGSRWPSPQWHRAIRVS
jgi:hypothetical protein